MNPIFPWLGIAVLILCGWAIIKKYQVNMVLLLGGLLLNALAIWGGAQVFPAKFNATGIMGFDLVEFLRTISVSQVSGVGFLILISGGFAAYMQAIGASDRFVTVCAKPLSFIKNPYLILRSSSASAARPWPQPPSWRACSRSATRRLRARPTSPLRSSTSIRSNTSCAISYRWRFRW